MPLRPATPADRDTIVDLHAQAREHDGHDSLGESVWRDLDTPHVDSAGFVWTDDGSVRAYLHVAPSDNFSPRHWALGLVVDPAARERVPVGDLLDAAVAHVASHSGTRAVLWRFAPDVADDTAAAAAGFTPARDLYQMRVPLPVAAEPRWPAGLTVRPFEPGRDEAAWLEVNNRAFGNHPEQGGWIEATLRRRMAEPWFDPSLFLLAFDAEGLAGFHWMKVHDAHGRDPRLGEVFVIGVDPRAQGTGLGGVLLLAGLELLSARGLTTAMLFCAADNAPALALYRRIGFTVHRVDRAYEREVTAA